MRARWLMWCILVACEPATPEERAQIEAEQAKKEREEQEEYDRIKQLDRYYELEWVRCVNDLGMERCRVIQETGFHQCKGWNFRDEHGLERCVAHRFEDRLLDFSRALPAEAEETP